MSERSKQNGKDIIPAPGGEEQAVVERDEQGRFAKGNRGGPGNPHARKVGELRSALLRAVSPEDLQVVVEKLVKQAKGGNIPAAKELLDRVLGRALEVDLLDRLDAVEQVMLRLAEERSCRM